MIGVEPVAELRREQPVDRLVVLVEARLAAEAEGRLGEIGGARIGRHAEDDVAEVDRPAVVVGQLAVVHHLQQDVEDVGMRLLDLVEQDDAMRMLVHLRR